MAGRPRASVTIVPPHSVIPMQNRTKIFNMNSLIPLIRNTNDCIKWLAAHNLLKNNMVCACGENCSLQRECGECRRETVVLQTMQKP